MPVNPASSISVLLQPVWRGNVGEIFLSSAGDNRDLSNGLLRPRSHPPTSGLSSPRRSAFARLDRFMGSSARCRELPCRLAGTITRVVLRDAPALRQVECPAREATHETTPAAMVISITDMPCPCNRATRLAPARGPMGRCGAGGEDMGARHGRYLPPFLLFIYPTCRSSATWTTSPVIQINERDVFMGTPISRDLLDLVRIRTPPVVIIMISSSVRTSVAAPPCHCRADV